jgi:hypothetical protein
MEAPLYNKTRSIDLQKILATIFIHPNYIKSMMNTSYAAVIDITEDEYEFLKLKLGN